MSEPTTASKISSPSPSSDLHNILRVVLDKLWLIAACVLVAVIAAFFYAKRAPRLYEATATVQVEQEDAKVVKVEQVVSEDMHSQEILNTVAVKLCTPALLEEVLEENHLLPVKATNETADLASDLMIARFAGSIKASLRRNTRLIDITVRDTDSHLTALLANALVEDYLKQDAMLQQNANAGASVFLRQEAERLKSKLEESDQALQDYRKEVGSVSLAQNQDIITPNLQDLNKRLTQSKAALIQAEGEYGNSLKMSTNVEELLAYPQVFADPDVTQVSGDLAKLESDFAIVQQRYLKKHPKYILAEASVQAVKGQLGTTVLRVRARIQETKRIARESALTSEQGLEKQLHEAEGTALKLSDSAVKFNLLSREVQSDQALYDSIISRLGEMTITKQITPERIRLVQPAIAPKYPASPRVKIIYAMGLLGGLVFGLGISFVLNAFNTSFRTVEEAELALKTPVLAAIPQLPKKGGKEDGEVASMLSDSGGAEFFRSLRSMLSLLGPASHRRTILFTSSLPGEGKTFVSVNYAVSLAQQGLRTLLVDFDLRQPMIHEFMAGENSRVPGITDYLLSKKGFHEICQVHPIFSKLEWIAAGRSVPNPAELLIQADFQKFLEIALAEYDRVVIDTAPVLPVSDTLPLAGKVQTVVVVVQGGKTPKKAVERSFKLLYSAGAPMGGIVLNLLPNRRLLGQYYPHYYGYGYSSYDAKSPKEVSIEAR